MQNLPLEVFNKVVDYLELPDLRNSIRVNSQWRLILSTVLQKRQNIWVAFENDAQLIAFNDQFSHINTPPSYKFHFAEGVLCEASSRPFIKEFAEKFGNLVRSYNFKAEFWSPSGSRQRIKCTQDNIGLLLNYSMEHLMELIVTTNYELGPMGLSKNFQKLRVVTVKYNMQLFKDYDKTFLSELSERVPRICEFGIHSTITGANQDKQFLQKLPNILNNLDRMNNFVKVQLTFRVYSSDISNLQHLVAMSAFPKVSEISVMFMTSTWMYDTDDSWTWTTSGYKRCYNAISKLLTTNAHCLKKFTLEDTSRPVDSSDEEDEDEDEGPPMDLKLPELVVLQELNIKKFHVYSSIGLHPFHADHFPKLQSLSLNVESILWFPESKWEGIKNLYLYAFKDEPIDSKIAERLPLLFPNVEFLTIQWKLVLIHLALQLPKLIQLKIIQELFEGKLDYWKILTGMEDKITLAAICNVFGNHGRKEPCAADKSPILCDFRNLKCLQRLEMESDTTEVVGALIFMSIIGKLGRLKELVLRFRDETIFPEIHFVEELRRHHDSVKTLATTPQAFPI